MSLQLPQNAEPFIPNGEPFDHLHKPGVYCLLLDRPDDLAEQWDRRFDTRPDYWDKFVNATQVAYVGAASDVLRRLEEHKQADKRKAALLEVCEIDDLRNIWWFNTQQRAFERESGLALWLANSRPSWYVHQR